MPFTIKMFKKMFLQASLTSNIFSIIPFIIGKSKSNMLNHVKSNNIWNNMWYYQHTALFKTRLTCQKTYQAFVITVKTMVNFIWHRVTVLINVSVSDILRHSWQLLPLHLRDPVFLSIESILALTKWLLRVLGLRNVTIGAGWDTFLTYSFM